MNSRNDDDNLEVFDLKNFKEFQNKFLSSRKLSDEFFEMPENFKDFIKSEILPLSPSAKEENNRKKSNLEKDKDENDPKKQQIYLSNSLLDIPKISDKNPQIDYLQNHLTQKHSTVLPLVKKFMQKLKKMSYLKNLPQLQQCHYFFLNDSTAFYVDSFKKKSTGKKYFFLKSCDKIQNFLKSIFFERVLICLNYFSKYLTNCSFGIHPYQNLKIFFDFLQLILIGFWMFYIPLSLAFVEVYYWNNDLISFLSIFFILDIILKFNTFYFKNGFLEKNPKKIFWNYIKTQFFFDCLTLITMVINLNFDTLNENSLTVHSEFLQKRPFQLTKFFFFLKIDTFQKISHRILDKFQLKERRQNILALVKVFLISILVSHIFACSWYLAADISRNELNWLSKADVLNSSWQVQYLYAFYWASITMMTVGYGDISPQNQNEIIVCVISVILGCGVYAYNIGSIGMILQDLNKENSEFTRHINVINQFMSRKNICKDLQMKIREYLRFIWKEENMQNLEEEQKIIGLLSDSLKEELLMEAYGGVLKKHPIFFANFTEKSLKKVVSIIKHMKLLPDEKIFCQNENAEEDISIFFIMKGKVEISSTNEYNADFPMKELESGELFGEIEFFTGTNRNISAKCKDFTTLLAIKREEFIKVLQNNSDDFEKFCMIKDQILLYNNYFPLKLRCFCCKQLGHFVGECPLVHYFPDKEKIIKTYNFYLDQSRDKNFNRKANKNKALLNKTKLMKSFEKIKENEPKKIFVDKDSDSSDDSFEEIDNLEEIYSENSLQKKNSYDIEKNEEINKTNENIKDNMSNNLSNEAFNFSSFSNNAVEEKKLLDVQILNNKTRNIRSIHHSKSNEEPKIQNKNFLTKIISEEDVTAIRSNKKKTSNSSEIDLLTATNQKFNSYAVIANNKTNTKQNFNANTLVIDKIADSFETAHIFKNYFPENNYNRLVENLKNLKVNLQIKKKKLWELHLSKYTFFVDDLKRNMPSEIKKIKKSANKKKDSIWGETLELDKKSGFGSYKKEKRKYFKGGTLMGFEMKFSELVKNIMKSNSLKKVLKKSKIENLKN